MHELELNDALAVEKLIELCTKAIPDQEARTNLIGLIKKAKTTQKMLVSLDISEFDENHELIPSTELAKLLAKLVVGEGDFSHIDERVKASSRCMDSIGARTLGTSSVGQTLPRNIVSVFQTSDKTYNDLHA